MRMTETVRDSMRWFEVSTSCIVSANRGSDGVVRKNPDNFTTFARKVVIFNAALICA